MDWKILRTWANRREFRYSGSVSSGTNIEFGKGFHNKASVSADEYRGLLEHFANRGEVPMGTAFVNRPENSVGQWLVDHVTKTAIASYVGPILIDQEYAKRGGESDLIQISRSSAQ
jgi:hypothetical protein